MNTPNLYKGEMLKVKLSISVYDEEKEVFMRPQVEGIVGVDKLDVSNIIEAWFKLIYDGSSAEYSLEPGEARHVVGDYVFNDAALNKLVPNKYIEIGIEEHPGHGQRCELMGTVIGMNLGHKVSDSDMEAIANL